MNEADINTPGSLGAAFGGSAAGGLGGILSPRSPARTQPPEPPAAPEPEPAASEQVEPETDHEAPEAPEDDDTYPISVYLLPAAIAAASKRRKARRVENVHVALDAIDATRQELPTLITARRSAGRGGNGGNSLFPPRRRESHQAAAARDGRRRLWSFQATAAEVRVIDRLVETTGARSRSELISCAMEAYLMPRRRSRTR